MAWPPLFGIAAIGLLSVSFSRQAGAAGACWLAALAGGLFRLLRHNFNPPASSWAMAASYSSGLALAAISIVGPPRGLTPSACCSPW